MPVVSTTKRNLECRLKSDPAPLDSDSDFNNDEEPEPPKKKRRTTLSNKRTKHTKESQKSSIKSSEDEKSEAKRDSLPLRRKSAPGTFTRSTKPQALKSSARNTANPLYAMLGLTHDIFATPFGHTSEDETDSKEEWEDILNGASQDLEPSASAIDDSGSDTEDEEPTAKPPQCVEPIESEETEDEDEGVSLLTTLRKQGQKPDLIARSDQIASGRFRLKWPHSVEASIPSSSPSLSTSASHSVPASINKFLRDYQRDGVQFFYTRYCENRGGILGDDMGLGKTIQVIAFLAAIMQKENDLRDLDRRFNHVSRLQDEISDNRRLPLANSIWPTALIIVPVTVMGNWQRELDTWGYFEVGQYSGTKECRENVLKDFKLGRLDIVLASFELVRDHIDEFDDLAWSCIFLDEAHKIKNVSASITKAFNRFHCQVRFGLTGTALQNDYTELWPLLSWSNPDRLGTANDWKFAITRPLTIGASQSASEAERKLATVISRNLVDNLLPQFFLRRTKKLIKDQLPTKIDEVVFCPLTPLQIEVYQHFLNTDDVQLMVRKDDECDCDSGKRRGKCCHVTNKEGVRWTDLMLKYIDLFIKISNHLTLLYPSDGDTEDQRKRCQRQLKIAFPGNADMQQPSGGMRPGLCGKWVVLEQLLDMWKKKKEEANKVLIFSKSVKLMGFLELELSKKFGRDKICYLDGSTKSADRMAIVDKFNNDPEIFVFLISTTAGGTGLNLTAANKVVIFDPNWNPAHDLQAMDRAYRYGQCRDVYVYRLLGAGSLEELIYARQIYKQQQMLTAYEGAAQTRYFKGVKGDKTRQGELFGLKNLFALHPSAYTTKAHIERALVKELEWALVQGGKKEDDDSKKLGAFLVDDGTFGTIEAKPAKREEDLDDVADILTAIGVKYRHRNDQILKPTRVASQLAHADVKGKGQRRRRKGSALAPAGAQWPPKRKKHANSKILPKAALTPDEEQLEKRKKLLLKRGYIVDYGEDYHRFAVRFGRMTGPEQQQLFRELDSWDSDDDNIEDDDEGEE